METKRTPSGRRVLLINRKFQLNVLARMVAVACAVIGVFYGANYYFFNKFIQQGKALGLPADHVFFEFIHEQQHTMNWVFSVTSGVAFAVILVGGLILSHRVAGPLHRLQQHILDVTAGKTTHDVKFRKKDFFPELAIAYNRQMEKYRKFAGSHGGNKDQAA